MSALKILYVEDEPDIRNIAKIAMESLGGFTICECESGLKALESVSDFKPDLIILDVMMPGMNGVETLHRLRNMPIAKDIPALFMTAKVQSSEITDYLDAGALDVIAKPFNPMELPAQIETAWSNYCANKEKVSA